MQTQHQLAANPSDEAN